MRSFALKEDYKFARLRRKRTASQAEGRAGAKAARHEVTYACTVTRRCRELGGVSGDGFGEAAWGHILDGPGAGCQGIW